MATRATAIERDDVRVMYLATEDSVSHIQAAWARIEALVPLRGRKFYGAFYPATGEYRVCAELQEGDDARGLGLEVGSLPGGRYLRVRLQGEPPAVYARIGPTFKALAGDHPADPSRPKIEFYRSHDEIDLLHPVLQSPLPQLPVPKRRSPKSPRPGTM